MATPIQFRTGPVISANHSNRFLQRAIQNTTLGANVNVTNTTITLGAQVESVMWMITHTSTTGTLTVTIEHLVGGTWEQLTKAFSYKQAGATSFSAGPHDSFTFDCTASDKTLLIGLDPRAGTYSNGVIQTPLTGDGVRLRFVTVGADAGTVCYNVILRNLLQTVK